MEEVRNRQNYKFASYFVWVWNLICHIREMTQAEDVLEYGAIEDFGSKGVKQ